MLKHRGSAIRGLLSASQKAGVVFVRTYMCKQNTAQDLARRVPLSSPRPAITLVLTLQHENRTVERRTRAFCFVARIPNRKDQISLEKGNFFAAEAWFFRYCSRPYMVNIIRLCIPLKEVKRLSHVPSFGCCGWTKIPTLVFRVK